MLIATVILCLLASGNIVGLYLVWKQPHCTEEVIVNTVGTRTGRVTCDRSNISNVPKPMYHGSPHYRQSIIDKKV